MLDLLWTQWKTFSEHQHCGFQPYFFWSCFFFSYPIRVSCPVCSNKLCSNTDMISKTLWAIAGSMCLGLRLYGRLIAYMIPVDEETQHSIWVWHSFTSDLKQSEIWAKSIALCYKVSSEWVSKRIGRVPGTNFTFPQAPTWHLLVSHHQG